MYKRRREKLYEQMKLQDKEGAGSGQGSSRARGDLGGRDYFSTVDFVPPAPVDLSSSHDSGVFSKSIDRVLRT